MEKNRRKTKKRKKEPYNNSPPHAPSKPARLPLCKIIFLWEWALLLWRGPFRLIKDRGKVGPWLFPRGSQPCLASQGKRQWGEGWGVSPHLVTLAMRPFGQVLRSSTSALAARGAGSSRSGPRPEALLVRRGVTLRSEGPPVAPLVQHPLPHLPGALTILQGGQTNRRSPDLPHCRPHSHWLGHGFRSAAPSGPRSSRPGGWAGGYSPPFLV